MGSQQCFKRNPDQNWQKFTASGGVRTHASFRTSGLKSLALTTQPQMHSATKKVGNSASRNNLLEIAHHLCIASVRLERPECMNRPLTVVDVKPGLRDEAPKSAKLKLLHHCACAKTSDEIRQSTLTPNTATSSRARNTHDTDSIRHSLLHRQREPDFVRASIKDRHILAQEGVAQDPQRDARVESCKARSELTGQGSSSRERSQAKRTFNAELADDVAGVIGPFDDVEGRFQIEHNVRDFESDLGQPG
jgi:hypothetical protein